MPSAPSARTPTSLLTTAPSVHRLKLAGLLLALVQALSAPGLVQADDRIDARRHFQAGMKLIREEDYFKGVEELELAYEILPHPTVLYNIGKAWFDAEEFDRAIPVLERYIATDPADKDEAQRLLSKARARKASFSHDLEPPQPREAPVSPRATAGGATTVAPGSLERVTDDLRSVLRNLEALNQSGNQAQGRSGSTDRQQSSEGTAATGPHQTGSQGEHGVQDGTRNGGGSGQTPGVGNSQTSPQASDADAPLADPYALEVITASRYAQRQLESPNAITVISADDIARSGAVSLPDVLRRVPGMEVMALNPADTSLGIRGFNSTLSNKVLVLLDGRSVYLDFIGATLWPLISISPADIERIEVIRGPGAALYGAGAFSGVVNIITKTPGTAQDRPNLQVKAGTPDYFLSSLHMAGREGSTAWRASASFDQRQRFAIEVDQEREDYAVTAPDPSLATRVARLDLRWDKRIQRNISMSLSGGLANGFSEFMAIGVLRDFQVDGTYAYVRGDLLLPDGFSVRSFWNHVDVIARPWEIPTGGLDITSHPISDVVDVEAEDARSFTLVGQHRLNIGLGYRFKQIEWDWLPEQKIEHHLSAFLQDEVSWSPELNTTFSLRLDRHPLLWQQTDAPLLDRLALSPRAALVWKLLPGHSLRANAGTAFRTPTFLESYIETAIPTSNDAVVVQTHGNESLLPERIASFELGYLHQPDNNRFEIEGNIFINRINGLIVYSEMEPWPSDQSSYDPAGYYYAGTTHPVNVDDPQTAIGVELGARIFPREGLDIYANYAGTYIQAGDGSDAAVSQSSSPHRLNAGLRFSRMGWSMSSDVSLLSSQVWSLRSYDAYGAVVTTAVAIPTRTWLTARLSHRFDNQIEVAIEGRNLLAPFVPALTAGSDDGVITLQTAEGSVREHPQGQPIPFSVGATLSMPLW